MRHTHSSGCAPAFAAFAPSYACSIIGMHMHSACKYHPASAQPVYTTRAIPGGRNAQLLPRHPSLKAIPFRSDRRGAVASAHRLHGLPQHRNGFGTCTAFGACTFEAQLPRASSGGTSRSTVLSLLRVRILSRHRVTARLREGAAAALAAGYEERSTCETNGMRSLWNEK